MDTSALLTLIEDEPGADRVKEIFRRGQVILPWVALMEVYYMTLQEHGQQEAETRFAMLRHSSAEIIWNMDEATVIRAGRIKAANKVPFADSVISSLAIQTESILVHKDPEYEALEGQVEMESLPYKK
ncbi:MAG: hypothetical protein AUJ21_12230 [Anaerolineae bacterium CG1_02_58_13]|nr:MAG: hypothetical protein AUJ21_12230 [Anaerolineae bacterium CG1_02_58_13]